MDEKKKVTTTVAMPKLTKTKEAAEFLKANKLTGKVLVLVDEKKDSVKETENFKNLKRVFRNISEVKVLEKGTENVINALWADAIVILGAKEAKPAEKKTETKEKK